MGATVCGMEPQGYYVDSHRMVGRTESGAPAYDTTRYVCRECGEPADMPPIRATGTTRSGESVGQVVNVTAFACHRHHVELVAALSREYDVVEGEIPITPGSTFVAR